MNKENSFQILSKSVYWLLIYGKGVPTLPPWAPGGEGGRYECVKAEKYTLLSYFESLVTKF